MMWSVLSTGILDRSTVVSTVVGLKNGRRRDQREEDDPLAGERADVGMQADHLDPGDLFHRLFQQRATPLQKGGPDTLDQFPAVPLVRGFGEHQLGLSEHVLEPDEDDVVEQVGLGLQGATAHVLLLELDDRLADLGLQLPFGLFRHGCSERPTVR
jgi:hypothetical protein